MKTLNPFSGPGSLKAERQQRRREQFKVAVWAIVGANVVLVSGLLIQGCRREPAATETTGGSASEVTTSDTNGMAMAQQKLETNSPVPPAFEPAPTNTLAETAANPLAPAPAQAATKSYTVVPGDSFYKIARANGVPVKAVIDVNPGLDSAKLKVGQVLQLPIGSESGAAISTSARATTAATASRSTASTSKAHGHYVVKSGDTLDRIARTHRTTVQALKATNGLTSDRIAAGQTLKMPEARTAAVSGAQG